MIILDWPWALAALPPPLLARWLPPARPRLGRALRLPFYAELASQEAGHRGGSGRLRLALAWLAWALLVLAAARPHWLGEPVSLPVAGRDLMLAVDVSGSMQQEDYRLRNRPANRLDVVKAVAGRFIERRQGDRLGLILFGSRAYLQTPLTYDRDTVRTMLDESVIGLAGRETAIGDAIALAVKRLAQQPDDNRVLILLTDGANTAGNIAPLDAAKLAARAKVRIYTIGIGGGQVGVRSPFGMLMQQGSDLDPATLEAIAQETGERYFQATDTAQLEQVYDELDRLEPSVRDERSYRPMQALFMWPAHCIGNRACSMPMSTRHAPPTPVVPSTSPGTTPARTCSPSRSTGAGNRRSSSSHEHAGIRHPHRHYAAGRAGSDLRRPATLLRGPAEECVSRGHARGTPGQSALADGGDSRGDPERHHRAVSASFVLTCHTDQGLERSRKFYRVRQRLDSWLSVPESTVFSSLSSARIRCCSLESRLLLDKRVACASACSSSSAKAVGR